LKEKRRMERIKLINRNKRNSKLFKAAKKIEEKKSEGKDSDLEEQVEELEMEQKLEFNKDIEE